MWRRYLFFCTSKASKVSTWGGAPDGVSGDIKSREVGALVEFDGEPFDYVVCYLFAGEEVLD